MSKEKKVPTPKQTGSACQSPPMREGSSGQEATPQPVPLKLLHCTLPVTTCSDCFPTTWCDWLHLLVVVFSFLFLACAHHHASRPYRPVARIPHIDMKPLRQIGAGWLHAVMQMAGMTCGWNPSRPPSQPTGPHRFPALATPNQDSNRQLANQANPRSSAFSQILFCLSCACFAPCSLNKATVVWSSPVPAPHHGRSHHVIELLLHL